MKDGYYPGLYGHKHYEVCTMLLVNVKVFGRNSPQDLPLALSVYQDDILEIPKGIPRLNKYAKDSYSYCNPGMGYI